MKALAFSGGKDSMACLHLMLAELDCAIFVDAGYTYPETWAMIDYARSILPVHVVESHRPENWIPADVVPVDWTEFGAACTSAKPAVILSYHECCYRALAAPLLDKAVSLGAKEIVYGQRNEESRKSPSRDGALFCGIVRRHPIEKWTEAEVFAYLATKMEIPAHYAIKHSSLDCSDCTAYRRDSTDRVEWMRAAHPAMFEKYAARAAVLEQAIVEAL